MANSLYLFLLGNTPDLSFVELQVCFTEANVSRVADTMALCEFADDETAHAALHRVGGTVKAARVIQQFETLTPEAAQAAFLEYLLEYSEKEKVTFAISEIGRDHLPPVSEVEIKQALRDAGKSSRYVEGPRSGLSASVLLHHSNILELVLAQTPNGLIFGRTVAVQNIDAWTERDRGKPYADRKKGMLPPKVARMMVNLALGTWNSSSSVSSSKPLLYDPFCGSGTVLLEASELGCEVAGSDLDRVAVEGTRDNLKWWAQQRSKNIPATIFTADVTKAEPAQLPRTVDLLVTEPFLGKQTPNPDQLPGIFRGLEKLYWGSFRHWTKLLSNNSVVVMIFPLVVVGKQSFSLENLIDKLEPLGYTITSDPLVYHRPQAVIQRQIYIFKYKSN
ncbi:MAG: hypothetical protein M3Q81_02980 [bacterium]|nr:hypothetical protein [bacterium]